MPTQRRSPFDWPLWSLILIGILIFSFAAPAAFSAGPPPSTVQLVFVGDVMIGRSIGKGIAVNGVTYPFAPIQTLLTKADLAFGNLESPLTTAKYIQNGYNLAGNPSNVASLTYAGFNVVSLANNHSTDHGPTGLAETGRTLDGAGIAHVGAGATITDAYAVHLQVTRSITVAFLAYDGTGGSTTAALDTPGTANVGAAQVVRDIAGARKTANIVVVSVHWGQEYQPMPNPRQRALARTLARAGADVIIGHHPHVVQPLEWLTDNGRSTPTLVAYSLGNFIFDQEFSAPTSEGALLSCQVGPNGLISASLVPTRIRRMQVHAATTDEAIGPLQRMLYTGMAQPAAQSFSAVTLPEGQQDFRLTWWAAPQNWTAQPPTTSDVDGDGAPEQAAIEAGRIVVRSERGDELWRSPTQWQFRRAALDDVNGDGHAEVVALGQQSEEMGPVNGSVIQVWKWDTTGRFRLLWSSAPGDYRTLMLTDVNSDGIHDIAFPAR
jgi:poly-gamma-glutamate capsule biosynthesis protein CapA/YwtB (metallophosphatase superfamily)